MDKFGSKFKKHGFLQKLMHPYRASMRAIRLHNLVLINLILHISSVFNRSRTWRQHVQHMLQVYELHVYTNSSSSSDVILQNTLCLSSHCSYFPLFLLWYSLCRAIKCRPQTDFQKITPGPMIERALRGEGRSWWMTSLN